MVTGKDFYDILSALVPLYVILVLAYGAVRWWKIFTPDHCAGIHRFITLFSVPLLLFDFIAQNNPYAMNLKFIAADSLQKVVILLILLVWFLFSKNGSLDWVITLFSVAAFPNTLIIGVPLIEAMYGEYSGNLLVQIVVMQCLLWYNVLLVLFEFRGAKILISKKFPDNAGFISSVIVEPDVMSLNGLEDVDADAEIDQEGKLCVNVRRSFRVKSYTYSRSKSVNSYMSGGSPSMEIYGEQSFREPTARKEIHMFEWNSDAGQVLEGGEKTVNGANVSRAASPDLGLDASKAASRPHAADSAGLDEIRNASFDRAEKKSQPVDVSETSDMAGDVEEEGKIKNHQKPPISVFTKLILIMAWRRMIRIPNTYATVFGLIWSLTAFRFGFSMPKIMSRTISILSTTGLGLSMFSIGLFMASQTKMISCRKKIATFAMLMKFLIGPAVAAASAAAVGIRGDLLRISIVQAALPMAIVPIVFAKEYNNMHEDIISTSVSFGMLIALPVMILYYVLMEL